MQGTNRLAQVVQPIGQVGWNFDKMYSISRIEG